MSGHSPTGIEALVCEDIAARQAMGIAKYGKTVAANLLSHRAWLEHAYQECLDMAVYLRRAMAELDGANGGGGLGTACPTGEAVGRALAGQEATGNNQREAN